MRSKRHDSFERVHRFFGWTSILLVWAQVVVLTNDYREDQSLSHALVHSAPFWMLLVMTGSIILPWLRLRKVPVRAEVLSKHAVRLYFTYSTPISGSFVRLAVHPLKDWHGFATIPAPREKGFSLVVSRAGDWTNSRITDAPSTIWVRGAPCFGVLRIVPLFRRVVFVATGELRLCGILLKLTRKQEAASGPVRRVSSNKGSLSGSSGHHPTSAKHSGTNSWMRFWVRRRMR
jgi:hypothetical protein